VKALGVLLLLLPILLLLMLLPLLLRSLPLLKLPHVLSLSEWLLLPLTIRV
jgi:hypothetical protein